MTPIRWFNRRFLSITLPRISSNYSKLRISLNLANLRKNLHPQKEEKPWPVRTVILDHTTYSPKLVKATHFPTLRVSEVGGVNWRWCLISPQVWGDFWKPTPVLYHRKQWKCQKGWTTWGKLETKIGVLINMIPRCWQPLCILINRDAMLRRQATVIVLQGEWSVGTPESLTGCPTKPLY